MGGSREFLLQHESQLICKSLMNYDIVGHTELKVFKSQVRLRKRRPSELLNTYFVQGTKEMFLTLALPSVSVGVESGCWTEGQGPGPVKY